MEIIVGKTAGFCFGVKNAVDKAEKELDKKEKTYCLGELVHNKQVTEKLMNKGMIFIEDIDNATGKIIIRSHGVEKNIYEKAKTKEIELIDLTCPKVLHIHNIAEEYKDKGYFILLVGKAEHPEMVGTVSFCGKNHYVIESEEEIERAVKEYKKSGNEKILVIAQTTFSLEKFNRIVATLKEMVNTENLEIRNTICNATKERQEETEEFAKTVDAMIIIGGKHSSNSTKLYELSRKYCKEVYFIETEKELDMKYFKDKESVGIMAGASTPQESIQKVVEKLKKVC